MRVVTLWACHRGDIGHRGRDRARWGARIFRKGGVRVDASNSYCDYFTRNLVTARSERRKALAVYTPQCFGEVTGLN